MVVYIKAYVRTFFIMGIATALAYSFGFHLLFAHTAFEALYWGAYFFTTYLVGNVVMGFLSQSF